MTDSFEAARALSQQTPFNAGEFFNPFQNPAAGVSAGVPGGPPVDFTIGTADLAAEVFNPINVVPLLGETKLITAPARAVAGAARRAAPEVAAATGRRATQAAGRILPERKVFADFDLPKELSGSKVNFQRRSIEFDSDLDRALYIATSRRASKRRSDFIDLLAGQGYDTPEKIRLAAQPVRDRVAEIARVGDDAIVVPRVSGDVPAPAARQDPTSGQVTLEGRVVPAATEQDIADRLTKQTGFDLPEVRTKLTPEQIARQAAEDQARLDAAEQAGLRELAENAGTPSQSPEAIIRATNDPVELTDLVDQLELEVYELSGRVDVARSARDVDVNPIARFQGLLGVSAKSFPEDALTPRQAHRLSGTGFLAPSSGTGGGGRVTKKNWVDAARRHFGDDAIDKRGNVKLEFIDEVDGDIIALNPQRYGGGDGILKVIEDIEAARASRGGSARVEGQLEETMRLRDLAAGQLRRFNVPDITDLPAGTPDTRPLRRPALDIPEGPIPLQDSLDITSGRSAGGVPLDISPTKRQASIDSTPLGRDGMQPPRQPPLPGDDLPIPDPYGGRPRTLNDMVREARAMRGFTPEQRAAISDANRPIGDVIYRVGEFDAVLDRLPEGGKLYEAARKVPGARRIVGLVEGTRINSDQPINRLAQQTSLFIETEKAKVRVAVMAWMNDAGPAFGFNKKTGLAEAVDLSGAAPDGWKSLRTINDIVDHPEHYVLSPHQTAVLKRAQDMTAQALRDSQRVGVDVVELTEDYWHRIVTKGPRETDSGAQVRVAARKRGHTLARSFEDVEEGLTGGWEYEFDPAIILTARMEATVELIARANYRNKLNAFPGVQTPSERIPKQVTDEANRARAIRDARKDAMAQPGGNRVHKMQELREAEADFVVARHNLNMAGDKAKLPGTHEVRLPSGRIAPKELMDGMDRLIFTGGSTSTVQEIFRLVRVTLTTLDLAAGFIQGQATFFRNNRAWWKAQQQGLLSLIDDPHAYYAKNRDVMHRGIDGGAINQPSEYLFARNGISSLPTRIPVVGNLLRASNRAFETFIIVAQTELYKVAESRILKAGDAAERRQQLISLGNAIRRGTGSESYAAIGISPRQQTIEALTFFAPRFLRGTVGIMAMTVRGGPGGREARRMMGSMIAGATAITIGINYATTGRLPNFTNPEASDFGKFHVGKSVFTAFGPYHPYLRTMARVGVQTADLRFNDARREIGRFVTSKLGIPFRFAQTALDVAYTGESRTFDGEVIDLSPEGALTFIGDQAPIAPSDIIKGFSEGRPESISELFGLNAVGIADSTGLLMLEAARKQGFDITSLDELNTNERNQILNDPAIRAQVFKNRLRRGGYTGALADIEAEEYTGTYGLMQKLFSGGFVDSEGKQLNARTAHRAFLNDFYTLRATVRRAREQARSDFRVEFDDQVQAEDPLELALQQYFVVIDASLDEFGNFDSAEFNKGLKKLEGQWTEAQIQYLADYRNRRHYPDGLQLLLDIEDVSLQKIERAWRTWKQAIDNGLIRNELIEHFQKQ